MANTGTARRKVASGTPAVICTHESKLERERILFHYGSIERYKDLVQREHDILKIFIAGRASLECIELSLKGAILLFGPLKAAAIPCQMDEAALGHMVQSVEDERFAHTVPEQVEKLFSKLNALLEEVQEFSCPYREFVESANHGTASSTYL